VDPVFIWVESSAFSTWLRESPSLWVFPFILVLHTIGVAFFVGANVAWDLRLIGLSRGIPIDSLSRCFLVMWIGFWVNGVSGVALLIAYPTKALTNPLFYVKLALIAAGLAAALWLRRDVRRHDDAVLPWAVRGLAAASLACWVAVIFAGRFLAYTCTRLVVDTLCE
jgi:hypothetical protein